MAARTIPPWLKGLMLSGDVGHISLVDPSGPTPRVLATHPIKDGWVPLKTLLQTAKKKGFRKRPKRT